MQIVIVFRSEQFDRLIADFAGRVVTGQGTHVVAGLQRAARVYAVAMAARAQRASLGDGTWKDLAPSTKLRRLGRSGVSPAVLARVTRGRSLAEAVAGIRLPILYDSGRLFASLRPGGPGYVERLETPNVVKVGTAVPYAGRHQRGDRAGRLPQRALHVPPDPQTVSLMEAEVQRGVDEEAAEVARRA